MNAAYRQILVRAEPPHVLVLGDVILDRYVFGEAERVSPEAPVVVIRSDATEIRLGGASSVAALLRGMDADVTLCGVVGNDAAAASVRKMCGDEHIAAVLYNDDSRPTTTKERILGQADQHTGQQIVRVDVESREPLSPELVGQLAAAVEEFISGSADSATPIDAVAICDYGKGTCTPLLLSRAIKAARAANIPVLVDPAREVDVTQYTGATLLKLNRAEARQLTGRAVRSAADAFAAAETIQADIPTSSVCVTLDRDGCVLIDAAGEQYRSGTRSRRVCDITGAGDMFLASTCLATVAGLPLEETLRFANLGAGLQVERLGVCPITRSELSASIDARRSVVVEKLRTDEEARQIAQKCRDEGRRVVFTNGCFDLLHVGHVRCLQEAASFGDELFVAINSDDSVRRLKGPERPVIPEADRATLLAALSCVDHVCIFDDPTPHRLLELLQPDVLVKGGTTSDIVGRELVERYGGQVVTASATGEVSTTALLQNIRCSSNQNSC